MRKQPAKALLGLLFFLSLVLSACGDENTGTVSSTTTSPGATLNATTGTPVTGGTASTITLTPRVASTSAGTSNGVAPTNAAVKTGGQLKIGIGISLPGTIDPTKNTDGFNLVFLGAGETLMRLNNQQKLEPWLAQSVTNLDPYTWQIKLRQNVKFWDGSPLNSQAVIASFTRNWELQTSAARTISKDTVITAVDDTTLNFKTPQPAGDFPYNLSTWFFVIHKAPTAGSNEAIMTGPYHPTKLVKDQEVTLEAFPGYWGGVAPVGTLSIRQITDANTRALALQSGDLDLVYGIPPQLVQNLGSDIEKITGASTRIDYVLLNVTRFPFDDKTVRQATSLAIDREALNQVGFNGLGQVAKGVYPSNAGVEVVQTEFYDLAKARQLLEDAGWKVGADGIREKDGKKLSFTLTSYPGRAELTPMGVAISGQLKPLGYDIKLQEVQDINGQLKQGFEAAMYSFNPLATGDPQYTFGYSFIKGANNNFGGYANDDLEKVYSQIQAEADPAKRQALANQMQEIVKGDVPDIFLASQPLVVAYKKGKLKNFVLYPNDLYFIDNKLAA